MSAQRTIAYVSISVIALVSGLVLLARREGPSVRERSIAKVDSVVPSPSPSQIAASPTVDCEELSPEQHSFLWRPSEDLAAPITGIGACPKPIALHKTHKTGSATVQGMLFQSSVCSKCSMYDQRSSGGVLRTPPTEEILAEIEGWGGAKQGSASRLTLHISGTGHDAPSPFRVQREWMQGANGHARAFAPGAALLTSVRDPVSRWMSHVLFFHEPSLAMEAEKNGRSHSPARILVEAARSCTDPGVMAAEFGVHDEDALGDFVRDELPTLGGIAVLEDLEWSMLVAALRLRLRPEDLVYFTVNSSGGDMARLKKAKGLRPLSKEMRDQLADQPAPAKAEGEDGGVDRYEDAKEPGWEAEVRLQWYNVRWDSKRVFPTPKRASLGRKLLARIQECVQLDQKLYDAAREQVGVWRRELEEALGEDLLHENLEVLRAAVRAVREEVTRRLEAGEDVRPGMSNARTWPNTGWMMDPTTVSLSGLLTMNEMDRNAMLKDWNGALSAAQGGERWGERKWTKQDAATVLEAYEDACKLRDDVVKLATRAVGNHSHIAGFRCLPK